MAEEKPADERTQAATPRRKQQAREKGDRLASRELATASAGVAGALWLWGAGESLAGALKTAMAHGLSLDRDDLDQFQPLEQAMSLLSGLAGPMLALGMVIVVAAALGQGLTGGIGFTPGVLAPKVDRFNPLKGLKRIFGAQGPVELLKALAKALLLLGVAWLILRRNLPVLAGLSAMPLESAAPALGSIALSLMFWLSAALVLIAGADLPWQLFQYLKKLRMSVQDVKDEYRQQEGSPEVRAALRRAARDALKRSSRAGVAEATVVLTNPTHFAVALRYRPETDAAPTIVARGRGLVAEVIRELAAEQGTPILSYPSVARALYFTGRVGAHIRPDLYAAVATILAFVLRVGAAADQARDAPAAEAPPSAWYDETGRRILA